MIELEQFIEHKIPMVRLQDLPTDLAKKAREERNTGSLVPQWLKSLLLTNSIPFLTLYRPNLPTYTGDIVGRFKRLSQCQPHPFMETMVISFYSLPNFTLYSDKNCMIFLNVYYYDESSKGRHHLQLTYFIRTGVITSVLPMSEKSDDPITACRISALSNKSKQFINFGSKYDLTDPANLSFGKEGSRLLITKLSLV